MCGRGFATSRLSPEDQIDAVRPRCDLGIKLLYTKLLLKYR
jgi:hypothetical protein